MATRTTTTENTVLPELTNDGRASVFKKLTAGCQHLFSKGKLQEDRALPVIKDFMLFAKNDPLFLAHFTSWVMQHSDSKDLKLMSTFANFMNDADGSPFFPGSKYNKPNLRVVSEAAIQDRAFDAKMLLRLMDLAVKKKIYSDLDDGIPRRHRPTALLRAIRKYLRFREVNLKAIEGVKKSGLGKTYRLLYKMAQIGPSDEAASILRWKQKNRHIEIKKSLFDFSGMKDLDIAKKIQAEKIPALTALSALPEKISPVIAVAILENATPDQAVILRETWDSQGILKNKEVKDLFASKIQNAKTALDRVEKINTEIDESIQIVLKQAKSDRRKKELADSGLSETKVFVHIDVSSSMSSAIRFAIEYGTIIAECIPNPQVNFAWAGFNTGKISFKNPVSFDKDGFAQALYGTVPSGGTLSMSAWGEARRHGADIDIFITDCDDNKPALIGDILKETIRTGWKMPRVIVVPVTAQEVHINRFVQQFTANGVEVHTLDPKVLKESALVAQALKSAMVGESHFINEVMNTPLLKLPSWYCTV